MKFVDEQIPKTKATLDDIYKNGNKIFLGNNEELVILNANSSEFFSVKDNNGKLSVNLNGLKLDEDGITSNSYYDKTNGSDFAQMEDVNRLKPYQVVVASNSFDVSQVKNDDITVIFSNTTGGNGTLTIPSANTANQGTTITLVSYATKIHFSEPFINIHGNVRQPGEGEGYVKRKLKFINNSWYEIL